MEERKESIIVPFFGAINYDKISKLMSLVLHHHKNDPSKEIKLVICSNGGMCDPTFMFIDMIKLYRVNLTTIASGGVGSMAVLLFASGKKRMITEHTGIFLHDPSFNPCVDQRLSFTGFSTKQESIGVDQEWYAEFIAEKTCGKLNVERVKELMASESYIYPKQVLELGLAHEII